MRKFLFSLIAAVVLVGAAAKPGQSYTVYAQLNIGNRSNKCADIDVLYYNYLGQGKHDYAFLKPGESKHMSIQNDDIYPKPKIVADIVHCDSKQLIVKRYDYMPNHGGSQLSIHNQGSTVIMRHGP